MVVLGRATSGLGRDGRQTRAPQQSQVAARQARGGLDRAIRAIVLASVRCEEARFARAHLDEARVRELSDEQKLLHHRLHQAVGALAQCQRTAGVVAERVVTLLKDIVASNVLDPSLEQSIRRQVVEWGVDAYYAA